MVHTIVYESPIGKMLLAEKQGALIGLWLEYQKYFPADCNLWESRETDILTQTKNWLDRYFAGQQPDIRELKLAPEGSEFRRAVWRILMEIPYGSVITYGEIAKKIASLQGTQCMSAQAVGGAVGHNPISVIIPCHRVVGSNGTLTGYAGGLNAKKWLLEWEQNAKKLPREGGTA